MNTRRRVRQPAPPLAAMVPHPPSSCLFPPQLAESEQQYAEIYEEYTKGQEFFAQLEAAMNKAQQAGAGRWACWGGRWGAPLAGGGGPGLTQPCSGCIACLLACACVC